MFQGDCTPISGRLAAGHLAIKNSQHVHHRADKI